MVVKRPLSSLPRRSKPKHAPRKLTIAAFLDMASAQHQRCAVCGEKTEGKPFTPEGLHTWYHPGTGQGKRLVCFHCWAALRAAGDKPDIVAHLASFLEMFL